MSDTSDKDLEGIVCKLCHNPPQWMPIETCPREEGLRVLLMDNEEEVENSCWDGEQWILRRLSPGNVVAWLPVAAIGTQGIKHRLNDPYDEGEQSGTLVIGRDYSIFQLAAGPEDTPHKAPAAASPPKEQTSKPCSRSYIVDYGHKQTSAFYTSANSSRSRVCGPKGTT